MTFLSQRSSAARFYSIGEMEAFVSIVRCLPAKIFTTRNNFWPHLSCEQFPMCPRHWLTSFRTIRLARGQTLRPMPDGVRRDVLGRPSATAIRKTPDSYL